MAVAFDAVGPSSAGATIAGNTTLQWQHTAGATATCVLVFVSNGVAPDTGYTTSATYGGVAMTSMGVVHTNNSNAGYIQGWYLLNPSTGTQTVTITSSSAPDTMNGASLSYTGVGSVGTPVTAAGFTTSATVTVTSATGNMVVAGFASGSSFNATTTGGTQRFARNQNNNTGAGNLVGADSAGATSVTLATTISSSDYWGAIGINLIAGSAGGATVNAIAVLGTTSIATPAIVATNPNASVSPATIATSVAINAPTLASIYGVSGTYFTKDGQPDLIVNAEDWGLLCNGGLNNSGDFLATYDQYFTTRQGQGYNAWYGCWCSFNGSGTGVDGTYDGADSDGTYPFSTNMDPTTTPNSTFWSRRDYFLNSAAAHGIRVFLNVTTPYLDFNTPVPQKSWTQAQWSAFGTFLGNRYKNQNNLHWMMGDDYTSSIDSNFDAFLTALRATGANQPISIQYTQESSSRFDYHGDGGGSKPWGTSHAQFNWGYSYIQTYSIVEKMATEANPLPYMWADGYFLQNAASPLTDVQLMRRFIWWALSSGSRGFTVGDDAVWPWASTALGVITSNTFYTTVIPAIASYFRSLPNWHKLAPDVNSQLVTSGRGTHVALPTSDVYYGANSPGDSDNYVSASRTADGTLAVIYMSKGSTITIDETKMGSGYTATWVDPKTCATSTATTGATYNSTAKGNNSDGLNEWVLVLRSSNPIAGGSVTASTIAPPTVTIGAPSTVGGTGVNVSPSTIAPVVVSVPTPTVTANVDVTAIVSTIAPPTASINTPSVLAASSANVSASTITPVSVTIDSVTVAAGNSTGAISATIAPPVVTLDTVTVAAGISVTVAAATIEPPTVTMAAPTVQASSESVAAPVTITPNAVVIGAPAVTSAGNFTVAPSTIALTVSTIGASVVATDANVAFVGINPSTVNIGTPTIAYTTGATVSPVTIQGTVTVTIGGSVKLANFPEADFVNEPNASASIAGSEARTASIFEQPYAGDTWNPQADITMSELAGSISNSQALSADVDTNNGGADIVLS